MSTDKGPTGWRRTREPSLYQLPGGKWLARWWGADGKRSSATFTARDDARRKLHEMQERTQRVRQGMERPGMTLTLEEAAPAWLVKRDGLRAAGAKKYRPGDDESRLRNHVLPYLGKYHLAEVTVEVLEDFIVHLGAKQTARAGERNEQGRALRPSTIRNCIILVRKLLADHGYRVRVEYALADQPYGWIREPSDVGRFLDACAPDWFKVSAALAVYAGLRLGEAAGLQRDALDFDRGLIHVHRSYDGPTKSKHERYVPLAPELAAMLRPWLLAHPGELVVTRPDPENPERAIPIATEGMDDSTGKDFARRAKRACKRAGVPPVTYHQLRHTFASHVADKVPEGIVGALLGHEDLKTTRRYVHRNTEAIARDPRVSLSFAAPAPGEVIPFPAVGASAASGNGLATPSK